MRSSIDATSALRSMDERLLTLSGFRLSPELRVRSIFNKILRSADSARVYNGGVNV